MSRIARTLIGTSLSLAMVAGFSAAKAESADRAFNRIAISHTVAQPFRWINPISPDATGDQVVHAVAPSSAADFNRLGMLYRHDGAMWVNTILPHGTANSVEAPQSESLTGDDFIRQISYYSREMLDRGSWINEHVKGREYAAPSALLTVAIGDGVTIVVS